MKNKFMGIGATDTIAGSLELSLHNYMKASSYEVGGLGHVERTRLHSYVKFFAIAAKCLYSYVKFLQSQQSVYIVM